MIGSGRASLLSGAAMLLLLGSVAWAAPSETGANSQKVAANVATGKAAAAAAAESSSIIETVVVTAERRSEESQRVPIALTAISGNALNKQGITGFRDLSMRVPSLRFGAGVTGGENVITMRGLGSVNTTPGGDSPVAYSVDGVTLQRSTSIDPEFYDVDRVEILRGPQGTLYGRNSVGGSVNVITNKPTDELSGGFDILVGDYDANAFRGFINAPITQGEGGLQADVRLTGVFAEHGPYATNLSTVPTATHSQDSEHYWMFRLQLYFEFNAKMNLLLSASTSRNGEPVATNTAWWEQPTRFISPPDGIPLGSACDFSTEAKFNPRKFCRDFPEKAHDNLNLFAATFNWNLDWAQLTSISALATSDVSQTSDGDGSNLPIAMGQKWILSQQQYSEEIRLASRDDPDDPLRWIAGFYYFWAGNWEDFAYVDTGFNDDFSGFLQTPGSLDEFNFFSHGNTNTQSFAPFGQVDYNLAKTSFALPLTITAGARFTADRKHGFNFLDYELPLLCGGPCPVPPPGPFAKSWSQWTGTGKVTWQVDDDVLVYASASRGYISGGNIVGLAHTYDPESAWSYEIGEKGQFWDGHVQLNVAAYHEEIEHLQVFIQSSTQSGINNVNGLTQVNGLETELTVVPIDNLRLNAAFTLTHATYGNYLTTDARFTTASFPLVNFRGNWLNQTPPYTIGLGAEYTFDTSIGTITPRVDTFFSGRVQFLPDNFPTSTQHAYSLTDLHIEWNPHDGRFFFEGFIHNVENADVISNDGLQSISLGQQHLEPDNFAYYPPRTFGVRFGFHFG